LKDNTNQNNFFTKGFWKIYNGDHDERVLFEIGNILRIYKLDEWYRVSLKDLNNLGAERFLKNRGGLIKLLQGVYPNHNWQAEKFSCRQKKSSQWWLYKALREIFPPNTIIIEEFKLQLSLAPGNSMIFDVYIPSLNLIFEYQGYQHYYANCMFGNIKSQQEQDQKKRLACNYLDITYLEVPYWWQYDKESIIAIIYQKRPDIVAHVLGGTPFQYPSTTLSKEVNVIQYF